MGKVFYENKVVRVACIEHTAGDVGFTGISSNSNSFRMIRVGTSVQVVRNIFMWTFPENGVKLNFSVQMVVMAVVEVPIG